MNCITEIVNFGSKEAVEDVLKEGLIEKPVFGHDLINMGRYIINISEGPILINIKIQFQLN